MRVLRPIEDPNRLNLAELEWYVTQMYEYDRNKHIVSELISMKEGVSTEDYQQGLVNLYNLKRMDDNIKAKKIKLKMKELEMKKLEGNNNMKTSENYSTAVMKYNLFESDQLCNGGEEVLFIYLKSSFDLSENDFERVMQIVRNNEDFNLASITAGYNHEATKLAVETSYLKDDQLYPEGTQLLIDKYVMYESIKNGKDANEIRRNIDNRILDNSERL